MPIKPTDFAIVSDLVKRRSGIVLDAGKEYLVETRLSQVARTHKLASVEVVIAQMIGNTAAAEAMKNEVVKAMTTNETSFFRDVHPFEALKNHVLPALIAARQTERSLNFWCAASSSGQEPYTVAMILAEYFPIVFSTWRIKFMASDLSIDMVNKAKAGKYNATEIGRGLAPTLMQKHFNKSGEGEWTASKQLRDMIEFKQLNLVDPWPAMGQLDICFIRNVLIYFDTATKSNILRKARGLLRNDGFLFLGGAETTMNLDDGYERMDLDRSGCYRIRGAGQLRKAA